MGWIYVGFAAVTELVGVYGLSKFSRERTILNWLLYYGGLAGSFVFLYLSFQYLLVSVSYTVFIGIGTAGAVILNMILFGESRNIFRIISLAIIIVGVMGLKALS
ncbi:MAG TPA: SMR family transporter [Pseudogracilibacillus sp.]|nr:SMR family transporter [Pseudogracilibacillus sp.]